MVEELTPRPLPAKARLHLALEENASLRTRIAALEAKLAEMMRRRDEWRKKAEGYDDVRRALREKVGTPWPPHMSRLLWAGIAADEKKRADDAEAQLAALAAERERLRKALEPFAKAGELFPGEDADFDQCIYKPAAGDGYALSGNHLRAARRALEGGE